MTRATTKIKPTKTKSEMPFKKGYKLTDEQIEKAKESRKQNSGVGICIVCHKEYRKYRKTQITCGSKECMSEWSKMKYEKIKKEDPILGKAITLSGSIRLKGKRYIIREMLIKTLNKPCEYCEKIITLDNCSLDHKTPRLGSKVFNRKKGKMIYTYEEIKKLDRKENLQIICGKCNRFKSDFNDKQFRTLLKFIKDNPIIGKILKDRLNRGILVYKGFR